jgi:hypothetical protein
MTTEQREWCEENLDNCHWRENKEGKIDVQGNAVLSRLEIEEFPVKFGRVTGNFNCKNLTKLKTLKGSPYSVSNFNCSGCESLETLEGGPDLVDNTFDASSCESLKNLKGAPLSVACFDLNGCSSLETLEGVKVVLNWLDLEGCESLRTLDWLPDLDTSANLWLPHHSHIPPSQEVLIERWKRGEIEWEFVKKIMGRKGLRDAASLGLI